MRHSSRFRAAFFLARSSNCRIGRSDTASARSAPFEAVSRGTPSDSPQSSGTGSRSRNWLRSTTGIAARRRSASSRDPAHPHAFPVLERLHNGPGARVLGERFEELLLLRDAQVAGQLLVGGSRNMSTAGFRTVISSRTIQGSPAYPVKSSGVRGGQCKNLRPGCQRVAPYQALLGYFAAPRNLAPDLLFDA
jgi:hypothetical protein